MLLVVMRGETSYTIGSNTQVAQAVRKQRGIEP